MCRAGAFRSAGLLMAVPVVVALSLSTACSGAVAATGDGAIGVSVSQSGVTIENKSGTGLTEVMVNIMPAGVSRPYFQPPFRMYTGEKRTFTLESFRSSDGATFRPTMIKARSVKATATDAMGKAHDAEVPFP